MSFGHLAWNERSSAAVFRVLRSLGAPITPVNVACCGKAFIAAGIRLRSGASVTFGKSESHDKPGVGTILFGTGFASGRAMWKAA